LLGHRLDESVGDLDGYTHLEQVFRENFITHLVLNCLTQQKFDDRADDFGLIRIKFLITTQLGNLVVVISLTAQLFDNLGNY